MVWGREGKPASQRRCEQLKAARHTLWTTTLPAVLSFILIFKVFFFFSSFLAGGGLQGRLRRQALRPSRPVREENGFLQQSQGHGHPAAGQVRGECPGASVGAEAPGKRSQLKEKSPARWSEAARPPDT